jgi:hypothetical protein
VKGWFGETAELGRAEMATWERNKTQSAAAKPVEAAASPAAVPSFSATPVVPVTETASPITAPALTTTSAVSAPALTAATAGAVTAPALAGAGTATGSSGNSLLAEHLAAASRKGIAGMTTTTASDAFMNAGASIVSDSPDTAGVTIAPVIDMAELNRQVQTSPFLESLATANAELAPGASVVPGIDLAEFESGAAVNFQEAVRPRQNAVETPWAAPAPPPKKEPPRVFNIQNVNLNAEDMDRLLDFARQLELAVLEPVEAEV